MKFFVSFLLTILISQGLVTLVECGSSEEEFANQKNYYTPDPRAVSPPTHAHGPPRHHRAPACPPPPHGGSGCSCGPPHGGSPGTSTPPSRGGYYNNPPPSPTVEPIIPTPTTPLNPPSTSLSPPFVPVNPNTPPFINPGGSPPFIPVDPNAPPSIPGGPPGTCTYWSTHPTLIWGIFGYWATIGGLFGPATTLPFGVNLSMQEALENIRADGFGAIYREGTAAFLNSMVNKKFPFNTPEVKHAFASSLVSEKAAAAQARIFKLANEGHLKKQY